MWTGDFWSEANSLKYIARLRGEGARILVLVKYDLICT